MKTTRAISAFYLIRIYYAQEWQGPFPQLSLASLFPLCHCNVGSRSPCLCAFEVSCNVGLRCVLSCRCIGTCTCRHDVFPRSRKCSLLPIAQTYACTHTVKSRSSFGVCIPLCRCGSGILLPYLPLHSRSCMRRS